MRDDEEAGILRSRFACIGEDGKLEDIDWDAS
jgi:hypothetical protein